MVKATYQGDGDAVELDGLRFEKGAPVDMTHEQITRIRAGGGIVAVTSTSVEGETAEARDRTLAAQLKQREKVVADAAKAAADAKPKAVEK